MYGIVHIYGTIHICSIVHNYGRDNNSLLDVSRAYSTVVWISACLGKFYRKGDKSLRNLSFKWD